MMLTQLDINRIACCPFCGAEFNKYNFSRVETTNRTGWRYRVWCDRCEQNGVCVGEDTHRHTNGKPQLRLKVKSLCIAYQQAIKEGFDFEHTSTGR